MPKISVSMPEDVLQFLDGLGDNRSQAIVAILQDYRKVKREQALVQAYDDYEALCQEDSENWWQHWESAAAADLGPEAP
jgi:hypothetical protein